MYSFPLVLRASHIFFIMPPVILRLARARLLLLVMLRGKIPTYMTYYIS